MKNKIFTHHGLPFAALIGAKSSPNFYQHYLVGTYYIALV